MRWHYSRATILLLSLQIHRINSTTQAPIIHDESIPFVHLEDYGWFLGTTVHTTLTGHLLLNPVDAWLGIDYAVQPTGHRRFAPVTGDPLPFEGVRAAALYGNACVQDPQSLKSGYEQNEACLNFNVFRTPGIPLTQALPCLVWIHGGSFVEGSSRNMDGAAFVASSVSPLVVVTFNYRLNSLGSLPSKLFEDEGLLNLGLRDQKYMLQFLHKHAKAFGIDEDAITLGGRSAGAHSAAIHYFHNYNEDVSNPLFSQAIFQSGAVTARAFPNATYLPSQRQFRQFMEYLDCPMDDNGAALRCLREASIEDIQRISVQMFDQSRYSINWPFQPTRGGPLLEKAGSGSSKEKTFHHLPVITSTVTDEGKFYTPGDLQTNDDFVSFMHNASPELNCTDMAIMSELYPDPTMHPDSLYSNSPNSTQYNRVSTAWSDYAYICPSRMTAEQVSREGIATWKLRFNTPSYPLEAQVWRGIPHTSDTAYTWNSPDVPFPETAHMYHAYLASFVAAGDPNTHRYPGSPEWPMYRPQWNDPDSSRKLSSTPLQLSVHPGNALVEEDVIRVAQCRFWNDAERMKRLNK